MPRPITKADQCVSSCKPTPRQKTPQEAMIPHFRPTRSAIGKASKAPKNVPAERIDTFDISPVNVTSKRQEVYIRQDFYDLWEGNILEGSSG